MKRISFLFVCAKSSKSVYFILKAHPTFGLATFQVLVATVLDSAINHLKKWVCFCLFLKNYKVHILNCKL